MKTLTLALFLCAGIAGAYAQTNNTGTSTSPGQNQNTSPSVKPDNDGKPTDTKNNGTQNGGAIINQSPNTQNNTIPSDSTTAPGNKKSTNPATTTPTDVNKNKPLKK